MSFFPNKKDCFPTEVLQAAARASSDMKTLTDLLVRLGPDDVEENCFNQALIICVQNGDLTAVGKLLLKGARGWDEGIDVALSRFHFSVAALLYLSRAAHVGDSDFIAKLFRPDDPSVKIRRDDNVGHVRRHIANGAIEPVAHVPIKVGMRKKQYGAVYQLLLHTDCDVETGRADWRGLALKELQPEWLKAIGPWGQRLSFMSNFLSFIPNEVGCLDKLQRLNLAHNNLSRVPSALVQLPQLRSLNVSNNKLTELPQSCEWTGTMTVLNLSSNSLKSLPSGIQSTNLKQIRLTHNPMTEVPRAVCFCEGLESLDISHTEIAFLPNDMGRLLHLTELGTDGLEIDDPNPTLVKNPKDCVQYLRQRLRGAEPFYKMKMMIVGYAARGKTTLVGRLLNNEVSNLSTVGIELNEWTYAPAVLGQKFTFQIWDFGGQEEYYATHQCFLSARSLYLVVWRLTDGDEGIGELRLWLDNIAARAPDSPIIIVGTFLDGLTSEERDAKLEVRLLEKANDLTTLPRYKKLKVVSLVAVSCVKETLENIDLLKREIYEAAAGATIGRTKVMGEKIPASYVQLERRLTRYRAKVSRTNAPPIMTRQELRLFVRRSQSTRNDICDDDEFDTAVRFQHQIGSLLHFNDASGRLSNLYFIDPRWLCDMMATVITVRERNPYIMNGILRVASLPQLFKDKRFPPDLHVEYLSLLNRFEIALPLDQKHILIPSMLPPDPPADVPLLFCSSPVLSRQHSMAYMPPGFWSRLIARLLSFIKDLVIWLPPNETKPVAVAGDPPPAIEVNVVDEDEKKDEEEIVPDTEKKENAADDVDESKVRSKSKSLSLTSESTDGSTGGESTVASLPKGDDEKPLWSDDDDDDDDDDDGDEDGNKARADLAQTGRRDSNWEIVFQEGHYDDRHLSVKSLDDVTPAAAAKRSPFQVRSGSQFSTGSQNSARRKKVNQVLSKNRGGPDDLEVLQKYKLTYWRTGLCFSHPHVFFMIRKLDEDSKYKRPGIETITSSGRNGTKALGRLVDHINRLIGEWFPGLDGTDGVRPLVAQLCSCIECKRLGRENVHMFDYEVDCLAALSKSPTIRCPNHDNPVQLAELVPELLLTDVDAKYHLVENDIHVDKDEDNLLGRGGFGEVYRGYCRGETVAIKTYLDVAGQSEPASQFKEIRQEAIVLQKISHPNLVGMVGICLRPLLLVLDLAPLGSLSAFVKSQGPIHRVVVHKIAGQVAAALAYLHDQSIIFRDLKAGNVLLWSLDVEAEINIKLTDYGIATFAAPSGLKGFEGTKGFQAPEMLRYSGTEEYTCMVDVYAYAMFLYQLIARRPPFHNYSEVEVSPAVLQGRRPIVSDLPLTQCGLLYLAGLMAQCWSGNALDRVPANAVPSLVYNPTFVATLGAAHVDSNDDDSCRGCILVDAAQLWIGTTELNNTVKIGVYNLKKLTSSPPKASFTLNGAKCLHMSNHGASVWIGIADSSSSRDSHLYEYQTDKSNQPLLIKKYLINRHVTSVCIIDNVLVVGNDAGSIETIELVQESSSKSSSQPQRLDVVNVGKYSILALFYFDESIWCISKRYVQIFDRDDLSFEGMWTHPTIDSAISVVQASLDRKQIWCSYVDAPTLSAWNTDEKHTLHKDIVLDETTPVNDFAVNVDTIWIATTDGRICVVDMETGTKIYMFDPYRRKIGRLLSGSLSGPCGTESGLVVSVGHAWAPYNPLEEIMLPTALTAKATGGPTIVLWDALSANEMRRVVGLSEKAERESAGAATGDASSVLRYTDTNEWAEEMKERGEYAADGPVSNDHLTTTTTNGETLISDGSVEGESRSDVCMTTTVNASD